MEKFVNIVTIGDFDYYVSTGDFDGLKKYGIDKNNITDFSNYVYEQLNNGSTENEDKKDKLESEFKIQELVAYFQALSTFYTHKLNIEDWLYRAGIKYEKNDKIDNLIKTKTDRLRQRFHISVNGINDLDKIAKEIERRLDKKKERFDAIEKIKEGITFTELVITIFKVLDYPKIDYDMRLSGFFHLKNRALKNV